MRTTHVSDGSFHPSAGGGRGTGRSRSSGFTMIEILLAAMILSIGFVMLLPAFIVGLDQSQDTMDSSMVMHVGQNAEALCRVMLDLKNDGNFDGKDNGNVYAYEFGLANALADHGDIRLAGGGERSKYYWTMLFRFPEPDDRKLIELWIMICKRDREGGGDNPAGVQDPKYAYQWVDATTAGSKKFDAGDKQKWFAPGTMFVTREGEIYEVSHVDSGTSDVYLTQPIRSSFRTFYFVKYASDAVGGNACIGVYHTFIGG
jgi:prepilin-type N-terminal cleavage/methylation domain-containing protein